MSIDFAPYGLDLKAEIESEMRGYEETCCAAMSARVLVVQLRDADESMPRGAHLRRGRRRKAYRR